MRIAVVSTIVPNMLRTGSEIATFAILETLTGLGHEVTLFAYGREFLPLEAPVPSVLLATIPITTAETPLRHRVRWMMSSLRSGLPISSEKYNYVAPSRLEDAVLAGRPDLLLVDHVNLYPFVRRLVGRLPLGMVFHDVQAESYAMVAEGARGPWWRAIYRREARLNARLERQAAAEVGFAWFLSRADAATADARLGHRDGRVLPLFYPLGNALPAGVAKRFDIGLIGTWSWPPVARGMAWFLAEVVPLLPSDVTIALAGSGSKALGSDRVTALGSVPDAKAFLASCRVSAVPTIAGTGIQIKTLELAATGMPAVSTPLGLRGLDDPPANLRVAATPAAFAAKLTAAVREDRARPGSGSCDGGAWNGGRRRAAAAMVEASLAEAFAVRQGAGRPAAAPAHRAVRAAPFG